MSRLKRGQRPALITVTGVRNREAPAGEGRGSGKRPPYGGADVSPC